MDEEEKSVLLAAYNEHVSLAKLERDFYRQQCVDSKHVCSENNTFEGAPACSTPIKNHYSWDYAQQVHYPHHSQEVGPIYFKTAKKCEVFGVCCEGTGKQVFYLANEGESPGKGANTVVSYMHHYLHHYGLGEEEAVFHFDNCAGQNKNNCVLWYALWRVIVGLHTRMQYSMMVTGHTKFEPDWHFGLWKSKWRLCDAETIEAVAETVSTSSRSGHNVPHMVGDSEKPVHFHDWKTFLSQFFIPMKNISKYQHFLIDAGKPGWVCCKTSENSLVESHCLLKSADLLPSMSSQSCPARIKGPGLSSARQWYLYEEIGQFFKSDLSRQATCPKPKSKKQKLSV
ncbi:uncharacterized protein LOC127834463 [Dreissena polymorpha]|uniref:uncharacterized protein LOC127834463 n=1 Tax=Dreissena polymorpha TaxID=45954 RepID=UPI00226533FC|nr:uncharacterized protein LOC127834463 [Dreissena polymorpha]